MSIAERARPEIRALAPYEAAVQVHDTVRLNANEAPWQPGGSGFRRPLNRYPEVRPAALTSALAAHFACSAEQLLVTRGSSEAIDLLIRSFCRAGADNILTATPTFSMYGHYAAIQGAECRTTAMDPGRNFALDAELLLAAADDNTRLVFVCSPNNPTGTTVPLASIEALLTGFAGRAAVVVDEAYVEFSARESLVSLVPRFDNLVVLRTLSKALAFAGARCGAVIAPGEVIRILNAVQAPYALSTPVVECVEDALGAEMLAAAARQIARLIAERRRIAAALGDHAFVQHVWPSDANFLLARVDDSRGLLAHTQTEGVLLRSFSGDLADCLRISIGSPEENDALLASLDSYARGTR